MREYATKIKEMEQELKERRRTRNNALMTDPKMVRFKQQFVSLTCIIYHYSNKKQTNTEKINGDHNNVAYLSTDELCRTVPSIATLINSLLLLIESIIKML